MNGLDFTTDGKQIAARRAKGIFDYLYGLQRAIPFAHWHVRSQEVEGLWRDVTVVCGDRRLVTVLFYEDGAIQYIEPESWPSTTGMGSDVRAYFRTMSRAANHLSEQFQTIH